MSDRPRLGAGLGGSSRSCLQKFWKYVEVLPAPGQSEPEASGNRACRKLQKVL